VGDTFYDLSMQVGSITPLLTVGRWDEALAIADAVTADEHIGTLQLVVGELIPAAAALVRRAMCRRHVSSSAGCRMQSTPRTRRTGPRSRASWRRSPGPTGSRPRR
jgi:hypothetical protein